MPPTTEQWNWIKSLSGSAKTERFENATAVPAGARVATTGVEQNQSTKFNAKGASQTQTMTTKHPDGSSTSTTAKKELEHGDGKVTAKASQNVSSTNASGTAVTRDARVSAALSSGKDGVGAKLETEGSKKVATKSGLEAGAVVGLHANVACKIGKPAGDPKRYPVTLTVSFGGSAKVSGSAGKGAVGAELKGSIERTMVQTHNLTQAELGDYVVSLRAASKGDKVAAKQEEFAIIAAGVNESWEAAQQLWDTGGNALSTKTADSLKNKGDSIELTENRTGGASVNLKGKGVGVGVGTTNSQEKSTRVTRNDKGALDVDTKSADTRETNLSGSMSVGVASVEVGATHTRKTSFGYAITVDPKKDPDGKILEWLGHCTTQQDYQVFMAANAGKITVTQQTTGKASADSTSVGVSVAGVKASIGTNQGVKEDTVADGKGKLIKKTVVGTAGAGGKVAWHSDSVQDEAVAEIDGQGKASVKMTTTKTDGTVDKSGLGLSNDDLKRIGGIAVRSLDAWMGATLRDEEKKGWLTAGQAIRNAKGAPAVVAEQLARFVGGDRVERMKTVQKFLRGGIGAAGIGRKFEFPDALKRLQDSYEVVTSESLIDEVNRIGKSNAAAAVEKCKSALKIIDVLDPQIRKNNDFENSATKMEMLRRLGLRRDFLAKAINGFGGKPEEDLALLKKVAARLQDQLGSFAVEQARVGGKLHDLLDGDKQFLSRELGEAKELIRQLNDIHNRWWADYRSMRETQKKLGYPNWDTPPMPSPMDGSPLFRPNEAMLARYEKAAGLS